MPERPARTGGHREPDADRRSSYTMPRRRRYAYGLRRDGRTQDRSPRRRIGWVLIGLGGLIVVGGAWIVVTAFFARAELNAARSDLSRLQQQITSGADAAAMRTLDDLRDHTNTARWLTGGPAWWVGAAIPAGGEPLDTFRGLASATDDLAERVLPTLVEARQELDPSTLHRNDGSIDVSLIQRAAPSLVAADDTLRAAARQVRALAPHTWIGPVDSARNQLLTLMDEIVEPVHTAAVSVKILPTMLGAYGPKRYFVGFQNEAEARGTGGIPGAFGILTANDGALRFERFESDSFFDGVSSATTLGSEYDVLWGGARPTRTFISSNVSPHFPFAARLWAAFYERKTGERLDGAMALDPTALSYLLKVTGPAGLPSGAGTVSAGNVVSLTQSALYTRFPRDVDNPQRKRFLIEIARAVSTKLVRLSGNPGDLVNAVRQAAGERRLLLWFADRNMQRLIHETDVSGEIPGDTAPLAGPVAVNDVGGKLDYYIDRAYAWQRRGCGMTRDVILTATYTNTAPSTGLPPYVVSRQDAGAHAVGSTHIRFAYYATDGARLRSATVNGRAVSTGLGREHGHPVFTIPAELPRGRTQIVLRLREPARVGDVAVLRQPSVRPATISITDERCG